MSSPNNKNWYEFTIKLHLTEDESIVVEALADRELDDSLLRVARKVIIGVVRILAWGLRLYNEHN